MRRWILVMCWLGVGVWALARAPEVKLSATEARKEAGQAAVVAAAAEAATR